MPLSPCLKKALCGDVIKSLRVLLDALSTEITRKHLLDACVVLSEEGTLRRRHNVTATVLLENLSRTDRNHRARIGNSVDFPLFSALSYLRPCFTSMRARVESLSRSVLDVVVWSALLELSLYRILALERL